MDTKISLCRGNDFNIDENKNPRLPTVAGRKVDLAWGRPNCLESSCIKPLVMYYNKVKIRVRKEVL